MMNLLMKVIFDYALSMAPFMFSAMIITTIIRYFYYKKSEAVNIKYEIILILYVGFLAGLFSQTLIPAQFLEGNFTSNPYHLPVKEYIELNPYSIILWAHFQFIKSDFIGFVVNYIGNVVMFLPIGICTPYFFKTDLKKTVILGFSASFFIEFCQLFFDRVSDLSDLILNTLGVLIGYLIYKKISSSK